MRPTGWMLAGEVGVRRETVAERRIVIAAPRGEGLRRMDALTFLRFTLPTLAGFVPGLPERILIVSASADMWRGALSGPGSLYLHADRPLVSENGTSTLLHELVHVGSPYDGDDWIVEGMAEYLSLLTLRESGGLSRERFERTLENLRAWAQKDGGQLADPSIGADTACAVWVLAELDRLLPGGILAWPALRTEECVRCWPEPLPGIQRCQHARLL